MRYIVRWEIDTNTKDPVEACHEVRAILQDPNSTAWYFTVKDTVTGREVDVDLMEKNPLLT